MTQGRPAMPGPTKVYDETKVGAQVQTYYAFLEKLFDAVGQQAFRNGLFAYPTEAALRTALGLEGIVVPANVRIMLVDIQYARTKDFGIDPSKDDFYVLVLPPMPSRQTADATKKDYKEMQAWEG